MDREQSPSNLDSGNVISLGDKIYIHYLDYETVTNILPSELIGVLNVASGKLRDASDVCGLITSFITHLKNAKTVMHLHLAA